MKKKLIRFLTLCGCFSATLSFGQQSKWYMPPYHYDMSTATPSPDNTVTSDHYGAQSVYNNNGNLLFYVSDTYQGNFPKVFKADGTVAFDLPIQTLGPDNLYGGYVNFSVMNPAVIAVPVPDVCNKYYLIYSLYSSHYGPKVFYVKVDMSSGSPTLDPSSIHNASSDGYTGGNTLYNPTYLDWGNAFTVSKIINSNNERYLFFGRSGVLTKYLISSSGIAYSNTVHSVSGLSNGSISAIELSSDQQYLSFGWTNSNNLYQVKLNATYNAISSSTANVGFAPKGLQYDPTSAKLFITGRTSATVGGVYWNTTTDVGVNPFTLLSGTIQYASSQLQLGKTGNIYTIRNDNKLMSYFSPATATPTFTNTNIQVNNFNSFTYATHSLPAQIDGDLYNNFSGIAAPVSAFTINGIASGNTPPQFIELYTCNAMTLNSTSTYGYVPPLMLHENGRCQIQSCDASGNVISGTGYLNYSTNWQPGVGPLNLKSLPSYIINVPNITWLADPAHAGYYKITVDARNICGVINTKVAYIKLNAPPSPATMSLQMVQGQGLTCYSQNISTICDQTGIYSVGFNLGTPGTTFASNNIANYSRKIEEVDCNTGSVTSLLYEDATPIVPANPNGAMIGLNLNQAPINGAPGYFANNGASLFGKCYKLSITVTNACSSFTDWTYFKIAQNGFWSHQTKMPQQDGFVCNVYPNPAKDAITLKYQGSQTGKASISIYNVQGRLVLDKKDLSNYDKSVYEQVIDIKTLQAGMYFYKFNNGIEVVSGQISVL